MDTKPQDTTISKPTEAGFILSDDIISSQYQDKGPKERFKGVVLVDPASAAFQGSNNKLNAGVTGFSKAIGDHIEDSYKAKQQQSSSNGRPTDNTGQAIVKLGKNGAVFNNTLAQDLDIYCIHAESPSVIANKPDQFQQDVTDLATNIIKEWAKLGNDRKPLSLPLFSSDTFGGKAAFGTPGYHKIYLKAINEAIKSAIKDGTITEDDVKNILIHPYAKDDIDALKTAANEIRAEQQAQQIVVPTTPDPAAKTTPVQPAKKDPVAEEETKEEATKVEPKKGDPGTSSITIHEPDDLTKEQFDEKLNETFNENGAFILHTTYERLIRTNPERTTAATKLSSSIDNLASQGDDATIVALQRELASVQALAESDTAFKALHDTLSDTLALEGVDTKTKLAAAKTIMQKFDFVKTPAESKEKDAENISAAFSSLEQDPTFKESAAAEVIKNNDTKFKKPLQDEVKNIAHQLAEEKKAEEKQSTATQEETQQTTADAKKPEVKKDKSLSQKAQEFNEADPEAKARNAAMVGSAKYIAIGGAAITVTAFFPPLGAALLIGAALFCAYKSLKKPIKDYEPMKNEEAEVNPEEARIARMSSQEFVQYQAQKRAYEDANLANTKANASSDLTARQAEEFSQETHQIEEDLHKAQGKIEQAHAIANHTQDPNAVAKEAQSETAEQDAKAPAQETASLAEEAHSVVPDTLAATAETAKMPVPNNEFDLDIGNQPEIPPITASTATAGAEPAKAAKGNYQPTELDNIHSDIFADNEEHKVKKEVTRIEEKTQAQQAQKGDVAPQPQGHWTAKALKRGQDNRQKPAEEGMQHS